LDEKDLEKRGRDEDVGMGLCGMERRRLKDF
jgi:hypothetical protein